MKRYDAARYKANFTLPDGILRKDAYTHAHTTALCTEGTSRETNCGDYGLVTMLSRARNNLFNAAPNKSANKSLIIAQREFTFMQY